MGNKEKYNELAAQAILCADEDAVADVLEKAAAEGITAVELLKDGFAKGMEQLGDAFAKGEAFLPELILAGDAMKIVTKKVDEEVNAGKTAAEKKGRVIIGTVKDDVHDIGKLICISMMRASGFEVIDLGRDVDPQEFVDKAMELNADIIGSSALLTSTMESQRTIEEILKESGLKGKFITMIGGAPVSQLWADKIGAGGYTIDAMACCKKAEELMASRQKE